VNFVFTLIGVRDLSSSCVIVKCGRNTENAASDKFHLDDTFLFEVDKI
jgi:hypothetical protein